MAARTRWMLHRLVVKTPQTHIRNPLAYQAATTYSSSNRVPTGRPTCFSPERHLLNRTTRRVICEDVTMHVFTPWPRSQILTWMASPLVRQVSPSLIVDAYPEAPNLPVLGIVVSICLRASKWLLRSRRGITPCAQES